MRKTLAYVPLPQATRDGRTVLWRENLLVKSSPLHKPIMTRNPTVVMTQPAIKILPNPPSLGITFSLHSPDLVRPAGTMSSMDSGVRLWLYKFR